VKQAEFIIKSKKQRAAKLKKIKIKLKSCKFNKLKHIAFTKKRSVNC